MMNEVNLSGLHDASGLRLLRRCRLVCRFLIPFPFDHDCRVNHRVYRVDGDVPGMGEIVGRKLSSHDIIRGLRVMA